jgi:galactitol-specific phosphotransferase system IIC component
MHQHCPTFLILVVNVTAIVNKKTQQLQVRDCFKQWSLTERIQTVNFDVRLPYKVFYHMKMLVLYSSMHG